MLLSVWKMAEPCSILAEADKSFLQGFFSKQPKFKQKIGRKADFLLFLREILAVFPRCRSVLLAKHP